MPMHRCPAAHWKRAAEHPAFCPWGRGACAAPRWPPVDTCAPRRIHGLHRSACIPGRPRQAKSSPSSHAGALWRRSHALRMHVSALSMMGEPPEASETCLQLASRWKIGESHTPRRCSRDFAIPACMNCWIQAAESATAVAELAGTVKAFVSFGRCRDDNAPQERAEIWALYASPDAWDQGLGRAACACTGVAAGTGFPRDVALGPVWPCARRALLRRRRVQARGRQPEALSAGGHPG